MVSYLVANPPHRFARELLANLLWESLEPDYARNNLSVTLNALRNAFHSRDRQPLIQADTQWVALNPENFRADVLEFENALQRARATTDLAQQYEHLALALSLYQGEFLLGLYDTWIIERAAELQAQCLHALERLIQIDSERGYTERVCEWLTKKVQLNPLDEEAAARLMELHLQARQYAVAAQLGAAWQEQYRRLTGEPPPASVRALWQQAQRRLTGGLEVGLSVRVARSTLPTALPPLPPTRFVGREREMARLAELLRHSTRACITIVGLAGVGKTRLALEMAHQLAADGETPIHWVALSAISNAAQLVPHLIQTLGLAPTHDLLETLQRYCTQNCPLLFLDNFEHLLPDGAYAVAELLRRVSVLRLCITSRLPLRIEGETIFALTPLACDATADCSALTLFIERARQVVPQFELTEQNCSDLHALCRQLDGIPLALELAAARLDALTPAQMLERIHERLHWLRARRRDIEPRHSTMQSVLATTVALLPLRSRRLLAQLSLLPETWTMQQACMISGLTLSQLEETLLPLQDACLIQRVGEAPTRYRMLETVREFAQSLLNEVTRRAAERRLCAWALRTALDRAKDAYTAQLPDWLAFWDEARPLLMRALTALEQAGKLHEAARLMRATERYWYLRPLHDDALNRLQRWLDSGRLAPYDAIEVRLMQMRLLVETGRFHQAQPVAHALRQVDRRDPRRSWAMFWIVRVAMALHDTPTTQRYWRQLRKRFPCDADVHMHYNLHYLMPYFEHVDDILRWREEGIQLAQQLGDPVLLGYALEALIEPLMIFGEYTRAMRYLNEAQRLYMQLGDVLHLHRVQHVQASCWLQQGELAQAQQLLETCAERERQLGLSPFFTRWLQVYLWREQGELAQAMESALAEATAQELEQNWLGAGHMLEQAALCAYTQGDLETALRYAADAQRLLERGVASQHMPFQDVHCAYLRACAGDHEALEWLEQRVRECQAHNWRPEQAIALQYLAEAYARQGNTERARTALQEAIQLNQAMGRKLALQKCRNLPQPGHEAI
ncbi:MAG: AAA family ATPase [Fimbriimonadales bacterium]|nr:AAA family ATPase [Fimbriimonadales bacterium]